MSGCGKNPFNLKELGFYTVISGTVLPGLFKDYSDGETKRALLAADFPVIPTLTQGDYLVLYGDMPSVMGATPEVFTYRRDGDKLVFAGKEQPVDAFFATEPADAVNGQQVLKLVPRENTTAGLYVLHKYAGMTSDAYFPFETKK